MQMGTKKHLSRRLSEESWQFEFFQAVRLISGFRQQESERRSTVASAPVGTDTAGEKEDVKFRSHPSFGFPASELCANTDDSSMIPEELTVAFMGLIGPSGVLPDHYTRRILDELRDGKHTLHDFLDLFHHRLVSLFYRAWKKYRAEVTWESAGSGEVEDTFSNNLYALGGLADKKSRDRLSFDDSTIAFYSGHFSSGSRSMTGLEDLLSDYFNLPVKVEQYCARWLYLNDSDTTRLPTQNSAGRFCVLGSDFVLGNRIRDVQSKFRISLGPLDYEQFERFLPIGDECRKLSDLVLLYVGSDQDFDIRPVLNATDIPVMRLNSQSGQASYLGWNTWLQSREFKENARNAVFSPFTNRNVT